MPLRPFLNPITQSLDFNLDDWSYYVTHYSSEPAFLDTIAAGEVYEYVLYGISRYRLVPDPYDPQQDSFYMNFDGVNLTNLILTRG